VSFINKTKATVSYMSKLSWWDLWMET